LAFVFFNGFAIAMTRPGGKMRGIWIPFMSYLIITFIFLASNPVALLGGIPMFAFASMYKAPYGLPFVETIFALMTVMAVYPTYLFFYVAIGTKDRFIKLKSLLMGIGMLLVPTNYAVMITGAVPSQCMLICIPLLLIGSSMVFFGYMLPRRIEGILFGRASASADSIESFVERFFVSPLAPTVIPVLTRPNVFSKTLGLTHQQMAGRNILLDFDPASNYEEAIRNFATEALAHAEPTVIFTRMNSATHSTLREQKAVKFFCLTQQVSVPKEFSENEMLLPANDSSLMLDVLDKTLKAHPEGNINVVFDSLSDLIMSISFEKTYRFIKYVIDLLASTGATVLFLLNQTAHDSKVEAGIRHLFSNQISFRKERMQLVKLSKLEVGKVET
jgi:hypothetical protein